MSITKCYKLKMETPLSKALEYFIRTKKGVTQKKVAQFIGKSQPYVSDLKKGDRDGPIKTWELIAEFFGMSYVEFYNFGESLLPAINSHPKVESDSIADLKKESLKRHQIVIEGFENTEVALEINEMLVEVEKREPKQLAIIKGMIQGILNTLPEKTQIETETLKKTGTTNKPES